MANAPTFDENYQSVAERIRLFRTKYPEGSLTALDPSKPFEIVAVNGSVFVAVAAVAKRTPDDQAGGMGLAWCPLPGTDEYTRNSEIMNAQTSAWGRAIIAVLAADASKIASAEEVRSAESHRGKPAATKPSTPAATAVAAVVAANAATANATSITPDAPPETTDPTAEAYNSAVLAETIRVMNDPKTTYQELRDIWQVLTQARLSARRVEAPAGMEPDGDGKVPIGSAVAFVGKLRKDAEAAAPAAPEAPEQTPSEEMQMVVDEVHPEPAPKRTRKTVASSHE